MPSDKVSISSNTVQEDDSNLNANPMEYEEDSGSKSNMNGNIQVNSTYSSK